jgi:thymidylate synthase
MRSNDVMVGSAYDMFSFTLMQEAMAVELGCELGSYYHQVGSWHLYSRDLVLATEFARGTADLEPMPRMEAGLGAMIADEEGLRKGEYVPPGDGYWRDWRLVLGAFFGGSPVSRFASCYSEVWQPGGTAAGGSRGEP